MHSDVFSVIADPTRRRIVRILAEQTHTVGAVVEKLGMSQPTISKHLKVLRDADVVSVTVEGQRRLYSLNPDVFATVTEWINETVQIARQSNEAHAPVALPGGATAPADNKAADKTSEKVVVKTAEAAEKPAVAAPEKPAEKVTETTSEKVAAETEKKVAEPSSAEATDSETLTVEAPSAEEIEQARIQRARAQYLTPSARIYSRPAEHASETATSESAVEKAQPATESAAAEEAVDSTPMRPFTPASYGYDVGATPAASATPAQPAAPAETKSTEVKPAEAKPAVAEKPVVIAQSASVVSYGIDPAAVVGGSIQPIAVTPEAPAAEEPAVAEKAVEEKPAEKPAEKAEEKTSVEETVAAEKPAVEESATEKVAEEESDKAESKSESSSEETEYQTMPAYDSVYRPSTETTSAEAKDAHRGGLFGFLRGRRR
ncbi:MAG: metalloregulator ArsR/SmtB family transcription factor [Rothia sp.]|uniref:ArsR/SmtB family transcription factor n=1 Tax=Rothia sp. (in: high G+C Gram-positive bacteria) TaxID=1885016 RepID=UPI001CB23012|nr:metalloregulator ArsR/SmtB family transcription factor [Rothia sp. (in: high G+C Gram-positive bacteria)]MBF1680789.1 metalloregulator ArsR/SmtB family transcription factor [Rothia sp. (in: high G+C Gram-positive bacteria)]